MSKFDTWVTRDPGYNFRALWEVTKESWSESDGQFRVLPILVDEVRCSVCSTAVGWGSESGFTEFWTDDSESAYLCEGCAEETQLPMLRK